MEKTERALAPACSEILLPISDALYVIGGKWKLKIIASLRDGAMRFNEIQRTVEGISARVLSNELKTLELNGFVTRIVHAKAPVVVEYELTAYAGTLSQVLLSLADWGKLHRKKIMRK